MRCHSQHSHRFGVFTLVVVVAASFLASFPVAQGINIKSAKLNLSSLRRNVLSKNPVDDPNVAFSPPDAGSPAGAPTPPGASTQTTPSSPGGQQQQQVSAPNQPASAGTGGPAPASAPSSGGATLTLPPRPAGALGGSAFWAQIPNPSTREARVLQEFLSGNIPDFLRQLRPMQFQGKSQDGASHTVILQVAADYLAIGSDQDYSLMPMTPGTAQRIATAANAVVVTKKMVDLIYANAAVKLAPSPLPYTSGKMATTAFFQTSDNTIRAQRASKGARPGQIVAGHKKDIVITNRLNAKPKAVAIYGWHQLNGKPIQPLSTVHGNFYLDYSHGVRLVGSTVTIDGKPQPLATVLQDANLAPLLSDEGVMRDIRCIR